MAFRDVRIIGFQRLEITQLVQAKQADFPEMLVINLAFLQGNLAPNHLVPRSRITCEFNSPNVELLAFVHVDVEENQLFILVKGSVRDGSEVDVSELTIGLAQVFQAFADFLSIQNFAVLERE